MISSGDWKLDPTELKEIFTSKTKAIIFNNPNNPLGKVIFSSIIELAELSQVRERPALLALFFYAYQLKIINNLFN